MIQVPEHPTQLDYLTSRPALPVVAEWAIGVAVLATKWSVRKRTRRDLSRLTAHQLQDIGLSQAQAARESTLPFWKP